MPGKRALVDYRKCDPSKCGDDGTCVAAAACTRKLLRQEEPFEPPMTDPSPCRGCSDCARVCPLGAIVIASG
jgi:TPP-dependent indolepyruvate ferredoxin oxidoreductase alpha subunit